MPSRSNTHTIQADARRRHRRDNSRRHDEVWTHMAQHLSHCGPTRRPQIMRERYARREVSEVRGTHRCGTCDACGFVRSVFTVMVGRRPYLVGRQCHERLSTYAAFRNATNSSARDQHLRQLGSLVEISNGTREQFADDIDEDEPRSEEEEPTEEDLDFIVDDCNYFGQITSE